MIHYAPYGKNAAGQFDCGAATGGYAVTPANVTCDACKRMSPGLWPVCNMCKRVIGDEGEAAHGYGTDCELVRMGR